MALFEFASRATRGARRYQEDTALLWSPAAVPPNEELACGDGSGSGPSEGGLSLQAVAVLADGMGGHAGGALASRMACEAFIRAYAAHSGANRTRLISALAAANSAIADTIADNPTLTGMGSTLVGVTFCAEGVEWVSVGDSPLMLYRRGEMALLNEDHSLAPELDRMAEAGAMTAEAARSDPRRHMLRSAVTGQDIELIDVSGKPLRIESGDYIILASDGLHTLEAPEIERIVAAYSEDGASAVADALIRAVEAVRDPHQDNTTVVAVRPLPLTEARARMI